MGDRPGLARNVLHEDLATFVEEMGFDTRNTRVGFLLRGREHAQHRPSARHERDRKFERLDSLDQVGSREVAVETGFDPALFDPRQPSAEASVRRRTQTCALSQECAQLMQLGHAGWQRPGHHRVLGEGQVSEV